MRTIFLEFKRKITAQAGWKFRQRGEDRENATPFEVGKLLSGVPRKMCFAFGQYLREMKRRTKKQMLLGGGGTHL